MLEPATKNEPSREGSHRCYFAGEAVPRCGSVDACLEQAKLGRNEGSFRSRMLCFHRHGWNPLLSLGGSAQ